MFNLLLLLLLQPSIRSHSTNSTGIQFLRHLKASNKLFPPPPGISVTAVNYNATLPHQCVVPSKDNGDNSISAKAILCIQIRGLVMESKWVISSEVTGLLALLDEMIDLGYMLAKCSIEEVSASSSSSHPSASSTSVSQKLLPFVSITDDNIVGLIDICASSSSCVETELETETETETGSINEFDDALYARNTLRRTALDLNVPVFTDIQSVTASIHAWKEIKAGSTCTKKKRQTERGKIDL